MMKEAAHLKKQWKWIAFAAFLALLMGTTVFTSAQSRKDDLQKQREELNEKIALTRKLIKESESNQKVTSKQLAALNEELAYREQLLGNINNEIKGIENQIQSNEATVGALNKDLEKMKSEYAAMIYQAYKNRSAYDKMMFIFAADDFNQAYKRFKITQRYAEVRKHQVAQIQGTQEDINSHISLLQQDKDQKEALANKKESEKNEIAQNKQQQQAKLTSLKTEEKKLRDQQKKHEGDRKKLTAKIEEIIRKEIEEERKRAEAEAKKAAATNATTSSSSTGSKASTSSGTTTAAAVKTLALAPETKLASADFEKNKGALPWPVSSGVITSRFGRQAHPSLAGIEVNNNGLDFITEKNSSVLAVFAGTVTSVFSIPGAGTNIIVTHGMYKTVYSGLDGVSVKVGDKVSLKQKLGTVMFDGEENTLHFEVWKIGSEGGAAQNPEFWLRKR
jgi:septal ring factor EnvC (AmiA/AmiB activator)